MFVSDLERGHKRAGGAFTLNGGIAPFLGGQMCAVSHRRVFVDCDIQCRGARM